MTRLLAALTLLSAFGCEAEAPPATGFPGTSAPPSGASAAAEITRSLGLTGDEQEGGVLALFDGETLFGWRQDGSGEWRVEDGAIVCDGGPEDILFTAVPWADFELTCEFRVPKGGNSGVFVRSTLDPQDVAADCYEVNICGEHPEGYTTGSIVGRLKATGIDPADDKLWHQLSVVCDGPRVTTSVDGEDGAALMGVGGPGDRAAGYIGLQHREKAVAFRNVRLRPLNLEPLFDEALDGWHTVAQNLKDGSTADFAFERTDRGVVATGGPGFLESDRELADFVARVKVTTRGDGLNSGVFFRAEPGTPDAPSNGYEMQVSNAFEDGERSKPADFGTGAIFRRQPARRVMADDNEMAVLTLVADGPRFMTWVNGYPTVDWTDDREPNANPREGLRLEAGRLSLQAHDPTTDVLFHSVEVAELP